MKTVLIVLVVFTLATEASSAQNYDPDNPFANAKTEPSFPGGEGEMHKFLRENLKYPEEAKAVEAGGRVLVRFIVNKDGSIDEKSIQVVERVNPYLDLEAMRIVAAMPDWSPGIVRGVPVRVRMILPMTFYPPREELLQIETEPKKKKRKRKKKNKSKN